MKCNRNDRFRRKTQKFISFSANTNMPTIYHSTLTPFLISSKMQLFFLSCFNIFFFRIFLYPLEQVHLAHATAKLCFSIFRSTIVGKYWPLMITQSTYFDIALIYAYAPYTKRYTHELICRAACCNVVTIVSFLFVTRRKTGSRIFRIVY